MLPTEEITVAKRLVEEAVVENRLVVVAEVVVELIAVKFWRVEEPVAKKFVVDAYVNNAENADKRLLLELKVKSGSPPSKAGVAAFVVNTATWLATSLVEVETEPVLAVFWSVPQENLPPDQRSFPDDGLQADRSDP
jgi:hypothetical protein